MPQGELIAGPTKKAHFKKQQGPASIPVVFVCMHVVTCFLCLLVYSFFHVLTYNRGEEKEGMN